MQSHDDLDPAPTTEGAGGMDEEQTPKAAKNDSHDVGEQEGDSNMEEEAGEVAEGSDNVSPVGVAKREAAHEDSHVVGGEVVVEEEREHSEKKGRPGRQKKSTDGELEEVVKTPKRARPKVEKKDVASFVADRPTRERKSVDRFTTSTETDKPKELQIKQGDGTLLKDIPNVVYKLSKRTRHDETLSQLHSVLFNKRGKAVALKQNILQFSGYVWVENEEKERAKVQEKLERYTKESLMQFVDVLDIHVSRTLKKEDLVANVLEFLEKPHKTTDTLLELKEQERKSSGKRSSSGKGPGRAKVQKVEGKTPKKRVKKKATEDSGSDESERISDRESSEEEIEQRILNSKDETDHEEEKDLGKSSNTITQQDTEDNMAEEEDREEKEESVSPKKKPKVKAREFTPKMPLSAADKVYSKKQLKEDITNGKSKEPLETSIEKDASTPIDKETGKKSSAKRRKAKKKQIPSDEELQAKIRVLLEDADFSKVTFTDVVSRLEGIFGVSLVEQKAHVKGLIRDEISKFTEADDE